MSIFMILSGIRSPRSSIQLLLCDMAIAVTFSNSTGKWTYQAAHNQSIRFLEYIEGKVLFKLLIYVNTTRSIAFL